MPERNEDPPTAEQPEIQALPTAGSGKSEEYQAWALVAGWSGLIFVTIPFVRAGVTYVEQNWGGGLFSYLVTACVILASAAATRAKEAPTQKPPMPTRRRSTNSRSRRY